MKFHVINPLTFFGKTKGVIDSFHYSMFHGTAYRGGKKPNRHNAQLHLELDRPLRLHKNVYQIAHVFSPEFALVVSDKVREALSWVSTIRFEQVIFKTMYSYPYEVGDFSFWDTIPDYYQQQDFIDQQKNNLELHDIVGKYYELIAPTSYELKQSYPEAKKAGVNLGPRTHDEDEKIRVSPEMLIDHHIFRCGTSWVLTDSGFEALEPFIDWTYYLHGASRV